MMNPSEESSSAEAGEMHKSHSANLEHKTFKVSGNCTMCKERIENAVLDLNGVNSAEWNIDSKMLHISFNSDKISLDEIHKEIAKAGHDTEKESAPDGVYKDLPQCCKYSRD